MILDVSVHVKSSDKVEMGQTTGGATWLSISGANDDATLFFEDTASARVFLATALAELRRVEREDDPIDAYHDHIAVPHTIVMNGKEVTVIA